MQGTLRRIHPFVVSNYMRRKQGGLFASQVKRDFQLRNSGRYFSRPSEGDEKEDRNVGDGIGKSALSCLSCAVDPVNSINFLATSAAGAPPMNPVWQHFLETLITWGVPTFLAALTVGGCAVVARASPSDHAKTAADEGHDNPATELYDDLYGSNRAGSKGPAGKIDRALRKLLSPSRGSGKGKSLRRQNRGIPPRQYITMTNWNEKIRSYQYSFTAATESRALAAARYRQQNFEQALSTAVLTLGEEAGKPHVRAKLLDLEKGFLEEGSKLVQKIHSTQTMLTKESIEKEMELMGIRPFQVDPPEDKRQTQDKTGEKSEVQDNQGKTDEKSEVQDNPPFGSTYFASLRDWMPRVFRPSEREQSAPSLDNKTWKTLQKSQRKLMELELQFIRDIVSTLGTQRATALEVAFLGDIRARGMGGLLTQLQQRPLSTVLRAFERPHSDKSTEIETDGGGVSKGSATPDSAATEAKVSAVSDTTIDAPSRHTKGSVATSDATAETIVATDFATGSTTTGDAPSPLARPPRRLFVMRFPGDTRASQVGRLREEITAVVRNASPDGADEALVILESGGGTVTGYGLAAGQLQRIRRAGLRLTIVVEEVAASGGYMMCCVGDRIVGSPFAAFGSIGVITEIPNIHGRLKQEGVNWQTVTAGEHKRSLTPFKEVTQADYDKTKGDLESILAMFQKFVHENRPQLDIDAVATGEVWFGTDAVARGLCDEISTADNILMDYVDGGWDVFEVEYNKPSRLSRLRGLLNASGDEEAGDGVLNRGLRWLVHSVAMEMKSFLLAESDRDVRSLQSSKQESLKYMARYNGADEIRT